VTAAPSLLNCVIVCILKLVFIIKQGELHHQQIVFEYQKVKNLALVIVLFFFFFFYT